MRNRLSNTSLRTERNRAIEQRVQTADHGDLLHLVGDLLQRLELLEPHQQRIILHQFGRVEQRPRCGRLFTTANQVSLRLLFGGDYLVENVANVSGQDDVLESNYAHANAIRFRLPAHIGRYCFVDVRLLREHLFQRALTERLTHGDLQRAIQVFANVLHARPGIRHVNDLVHGRDVHTQSDLVAGQDFLTGHLHRLTAHFEHLDARRYDGVPVPVIARSQLANQPPIKIQETPLTFLHRSEGHGRLAPQASERRQQQHRNLGVLAHVDPLERYVHRTLPEQNAVGRTDHTRQATIQIHDGNLSVGSLHDREVSRGYIRTRADHVVSPFSCIDKITDVVTFEFNFLGKREYPTFTRPPGFPLSGACGSPEL